MLRVLIVFLALASAALAQTPSELPAVLSRKPPPAVVTPPPPSGGNAIAANVFLNHVAVNVPGDEVNQAGWNNAAVAMLTYTKIRRVRVDGDPSSFDGGAAYIDLSNRAHVRHLYNFWYTATNPDVATTLANARILANATNAMPDGVQSDLYMFEQANEPDNWSYTWQGQRSGGNCCAGYDFSWGPLADGVIALNAAAKADNVLKNYPIIAISHAAIQKDDMGLMFMTIPAGAGKGRPDGSYYGDIANAHNYISAESPSDNFTWVCAEYSVPPNPSSQGCGWAVYYDIVHSWYVSSIGVTATGYPSGTVIPHTETENGYTDGHGQDQQASVVTNMVLSQFARGYVNSYIFALFDNNLSCCAVAGFGIYDINFNKRLVADYIHNLMTILDDNANGSPGNLNYSITPEPFYMHDVMLQKSNGRFELVVWDDRPIGEGVDRPTIIFDGTHTTINTYDIAVGTSPVTSCNSCSTVTPALTDHAMIFEVIN